MSLNIQKLKEFQIDLEEKVRQEISDEVIQFLKSSFFSTNFISNKERKKTKHSPRVLNNWEKEGLIEKINAIDGKFRTFNKCQSLWLEIVTELREFGFSLEKIKKIRETLFDYNEIKFSAFEFALAQSILGESIILTIFNDGKTKLFPVTKYKKIIDTNQVPPHLHFNILALASKEFSANNFDLISQNDNLHLLTENELALFSLIRTGDFESIKIRMENGDIYLLEGTKKIPRGSKFIDIINQNKYQDIEVKTHKGEIVFFKTTEKIKLRQHIAE